ncbi:conserved hypothetical protein [Flavobacterium psychrophilum]|uniref:hypothetical protein n=1 Tax=Flavobacterium psychrophilum TaxID=96345 RepID=UPI000B7C22ED|nr:hypothetical protein [Flavobacterium psychrophilum]GEJ39392.1 hypothetical protein FPN184_contig00102-0003 [Flavobacterium psychrophilum]GEJ50412.1 hypothetical protein FPKKA176_contig00101-0004 [Flavobacterium psychrophilum]SNB23108.1 conserved hypothetical protein [Flavobacterium psychrophilum]
MIRKYYNKYELWFEKLLTFKNKETENNVLTALGVLLFFGFLIVGKSYYSLSINPKESFRNLNWGLAIAFFILCTIFLFIFLVHIFFKMKSKHDKGISNKTIETIDFITTNQFKNNNNISNIDFEIEKKRTKAEDNLQFDLNKNLIQDKFDKKIVENLIEIKNELELTTIKHFSLLLLCLKENKYELKSDTWFLEQFNEIFKVVIYAQFVSQVRNEIKLILNPNENLTRTQEKYLKLYIDIQDKLKSYI